MLLIRMECLEYIIIIFFSEEIWNMNGIYLKLSFEKKRRIITI